MTKTIKLLTLAFFLSFAFVACNDGNKEECAEDCKKECCAEKDKEACEPGCDKECCAGKEAGDSMQMDSASMMHGDEQAHVCTDACKTDPESCPHHTH